MKTAPNPSRSANRFGRFLVSGGLAAGANYGSRFVFGQAMPFEAAVVLAFLVGLTAGFLLMRHYAFEATEAPVWPQVGRYFLVNLFALLQTVAVSSFLARWVLPPGNTDVNEAIAHAVGVVVPVVTSYFAHLHGTFRPASTQRR